MTLEELKALVALKGNIIEDTLAVAKDAIDTAQMAATDIEIAVINTTCPDLPPPPDPEPEPEPIPPFTIDEAPTVVLDTAANNFVVRWSLSKLGTGATWMADNPAMTDAVRVVNETGFYETHVQRIRAIVPEAGKTYWFKVESVSQLNETVASSPFSYAVAPAPEPEPIPEPEPVPTGILGNPFTVTSLGNCDVGDDERQEVFQPFESPFTGEIKAFTFYPVWASGYGAGTGGTTEVKIMTMNSAGQPGVLVAPGKAIIKDPITIHGGRGKWSFKSAFDTPIPVEAGKKYFLWYKNIGSDPANNYIGVDILNHTQGWSHGSTIIDPNLIKITRRRPGSEFLIHSNRVNNAFDLEFVDGKHHSWPYMEVWLPGDNHWNAQITTTQWSRQRLIPATDMILSEVIVAADRKSGTGGITVELRQLSNNALITSVNIPGSQFGTEHKFCPPAKLPQPVTVTAGVEYVAILKGSPGTVYVSWPLRCGAKSGGAYTKLVNGWCEWSTNSGASWSGGWYGWNSSNRLKIADLSIAFR